MSVRVERLDDVLVPVGDLARAKEFYSGALGLPVKFEVAERGIALFEVGDSAAGLLVRTDPAAGSGTGPAVRVWLEVPDAGAAAEALAARGITVGPPFKVATGWTAEVADPWANVIGLTDYTGR